MIYNTDQIWFFFLLSFKVTKKQPKLDDVFVFVRVSLKLVNFICDVSIFQRIQIIYEVRNGWNIISLAFHYHVHTFVRIVVFEVELIQRILRNAIVHRAQTWSGQIRSTNRLMIFPPSFLKSWMNEW